MSSGVVEVTPQSPPSTAGPPRKTAARSLRWSRAARSPHSPSSARQLSTPKVHPQPSSEGSFLEEEPTMGMYSALHLFAELHVFHQSAWHQTHRWNYGLQQHLDGFDQRCSKSGDWSKPHLSTISVTALKVLRDHLRPDLVALDVDATPSKVCDAVVRRLSDAGLLAAHPGDDDDDDDEKTHREATASGELLESLLNSPKFVCTYDESIEDTLAANVDEEAFQILVHDDFRFVTQSAICLVRLSADTKNVATGFEEETGDAKTSLHARFLCFVFGSRNLQGTPLWENTVSSSLTTTPKAASTEFFPASKSSTPAPDGTAAATDAAVTSPLAPPLPPKKPGGRKHEPLFLRALSPATRVGVDLGSAMAMLMQDDSVVLAAYGSEGAEDLISAFDSCLNELHVVPRMMCPTHRGVRARAKRMLMQMSRVTQEDKWLSKQDNIFEHRVSIDGIVLWMQKFAVPLLLGITFALIFANTRERAYERWAGHSHDDDDDDDNGKEAFFFNATTNSTTTYVDHDSSSSSSHVSHPTIFGLRIHGHDVTLHFIVNDVFMCIFFGLAAKEIVEAFQPGGSLHPIHLAINPLAATLGGCVVPVVTYVALVVGAYYAGLLSQEVPLGTYLNGWGIPTATDISIAWVTALCVFGQGHPAINFLLLLAVVDDGLGLIIIAFAYPNPDSPLAVEWLCLVLLATVVAYCLRRLNCVKWSPYVFIAGPIAWFGLLYASLHPSLALVFVVPFIPLKLESNLVPNLQSLLDNAIDKHLLQKGDSSSSNNGGGVVDKSSAAAAAQQSQQAPHSPLHEFEEATKTFVDFFVLFAFGAVNAGVKVNETGPLSLVVVLALFLGKALGITGASSLAAYFGYALPEGMRQRDLVLVGCISSVGLTVALFISGEAFQDEPRLMAQAKMGSLLSLASALFLIALSNSFLWRYVNPPDANNASQIFRLQSARFRRASTMVEEQALGDMVAANMKDQMKKLHHLEQSIKNVAQMGHINEPLTPNAPSSGGPKPKPKKNISPLKR